MQHNTVWPFLFLFVSVLVVSEISARTHSIILLIFKGFYTKKCYVLCYWKYPERSVSTIVVKQCSFLYFSLTLHYHVIAQICFFVKLNIFFFLVSIFECFHIFFVFAFRLKLHLAISKFVTFNTKISNLKIFSVFVLHKQSSSVPECLSVSLFNFSSDYKTCLIKLSVLSSWHRKENWLGNYQRKHFLVYNYNSRGS